jgi:hypothetical protein
MTAHSPRKQYSIMVREFGSKREVELVQCDTNPKAIASALEEKYSSVRIVDHGEAAS